jgi:hypothetical protein
MNVEIVNEAVQFHFWEYINQILFAVQFCIIFRQEIADYFITVLKFGLSYIQSVLQYSSCLFWAKGQLL